MYAKHYLCLLGTLLVPSASFAAVSIDFEGGSEFAGNFRNNFPGGSQTSQAGGVVTTYSTSSSTDNALYIYDTTPGEGAVKSIFTTSATISLSIRAASAGSSFGIFIINPAGEATNSNFLALFNWDAANSNDRIRFFSGNPANNAGIGTVAFDNNSPYDAGPNAGDGNFITATLVYSQAANNAAKLTYTIGSMTETFTFGNNTYLANYEVGLRVFDAGKDDGVGTSFDNFFVSADAIPEPSALAAAALGLAAFGLRRRRADF